MYVENVNEKGDQTCVQKVSSSGSRQSESRLTPKIK